VANSILRLLYVDRDTHRHRGTLRHTSAQSGDASGRDLPMSKRDLLMRKRDLLMRKRDLLTRERDQSTEEGNLRANVRAHPKETY